MLITAKGSQPAVGHRGPGDLERLCTGVCTLSLLHSPEAWVLQQAAVPWPCG